MTSLNPHLSIVIPCKNEGQGVIDVIDHLKGHYHIIIADSSDDEITSSLLSDQAGLWPGITVCDGGIPSKARNLGFQRITTPFVLFLDGDIHVSPHVIGRCLDVALTGNDLVTVRFSTFEWRWRWVYRLFDLIQWVISRREPFAVGGFMLFRSEVFTSLGGFNERDKVAEDYRLSRRVNPKRFKVVKATAWTSGRRFRRKGVFYMLRLAVLCWLNRHRDGFFEQDQNYWTS
jgi:glycosyltransferase involved in cell wall biosynthesis